MSSDESVSNQLYEKFWADLRMRIIPPALRTSALVIAVINFAFIGMDLLFFPQHIFVFGVLRAFLFASMILTYFFLSRGAPLFGLYFAPLSTAFVLLNLIGTSGGVESFYSVSLVLMLSGLPVLVPARVVDALIISSLVLIGFFLIPTVYDQDVSWKILLMQSAFPMCGGLVAVASCHLMTSFRYSSFKRNHELQIMQQELKESHDRLQELDRAKTQFFSNVSHELRTPITLLLGPIEEMARNPQRSPTPMVLDAMKANALRLLAQVNNILDIAKIEEGGEQIQLEVGEVTPLLRQLHQAAGPYAEKNKIHLELMVQDSPLISFDAKAMETVFSNLLANALKFTPPGGRVEIRSVTEGDGLRIDFIDTGIGIPPEMTSRIFERFQQVDGSARRKTEGSGLGLALSKEIVELHKGKIVVASEEGKGSVFSVYLPIESRISGAKSLAATGTDGLATSRTAFVQLASVQIVHDEDENSDYDPLQAVRKKGVLLYADDNFDLRNYVKRILSDDYAVLLARNGREALELIDRHRPHLVLSDLMMPEMDGIELLTHIRGNPRLRDTPVIMISARVSQDAKLSGLQMGVDEFLYKPFSEDELRIRIQSLMRLRASQTRLKQELHAAMEIQQSLLPRMPYEKNGIHVSASYFPSVELSGDFFDVIETGAYVYFYVADVTSHGAASAQVTYLVRELFRRLLSDAPELDLPNLLQKAQIYFTQLKLKHWVTLQLGRLHTNTHKLEYLGAMGPSALLLRVDGTSEPLHPEGEAGLVGRVCDLSPPAESRDLQAGDTLFLYSDGVFEFSTNTKGDFFGERRLHELLAAASQESVERTSDRIRSFGFSEDFPDDFTLLRIQMRSGLQGNG